MPSSTPEPWPTTDPADQSSRLAGHPQPSGAAAADPAETQLELQFFAIVDGYRGEPPERVYWRIAVEFVVTKALQGGAAFFEVHGRRVSAGLVTLVALGPENS